MRLIERRFLKFVILVSLLFSLLLGFKFRSPADLQQKQIREIKEIKEIKRVVADDSMIKPPPRTRQCGKTATEPCDLCLFTTFLDSPMKKHIHRNLLWNWAQHGGVQPVLFNDSIGSTLLQYASSLGWLILDVPKKKDGVPVLKYLFEATAKSAVSCEYYGYANADIVFNDGLVKTLEATRRKFNAEPRKRIMIVGGRYNYDYKNSTRVLQVGDLDSLQTTGANSWAVDYFMIKRNEFPWKSVPDLVIGRPGYDNFMVAHALGNNVTVVDGTRTVRAVHLVGNDGMNSGFRHRTGGATNYRLIGRGFKFEKGKINASQYLSVRNKNTVDIIERVPIT